MKTQRSESINGSYENRQNQPLIEKSIKVVALGVRVDGDLLERGTRGLSNTMAMFRVLTGV